VLRGNGQPRPIRTLIVDRAPLVRAGLRQILEKTRFKVCRDCDYLSEVPPKLLRGSQPALLLLGVSAVDKSELEQIVTVKQMHECMHVVVLADGNDTELFLDAMAADADTYLLKQSVTSEMLLKALDLVLSNETVIPHGYIVSFRERTRAEGSMPASAVVQRKFGKYAFENDLDLKPSAEFASARLSKREQLILCHLTNGASNKQIARDIDVAEATVKVHVKALLRKVGVRNRTQAAMWAIKHNHPLPAESVLLTFGTTGNVPKGSSLDACATADDARMFTEARPAAKATGHF